MYMYLQTFQAIKCAVWASDRRIPICRSELTQHKVSSTIQTNTKEGGIPHKLTLFVDNDKCSQFTSLENAAASSFFIIGLNKIHNTVTNIRIIK
jgi:hypothetical protein